MPGRGNLRRTTAAKLKVRPSALMGTTATVREKLRARAAPACNASKMLTFSLHPSIAPTSIRPLIEALNTRFVAERPALTASQLYGHRIAMIVGTLSTNLYEDHRDCSVLNPDGSYHILRRWLKGAFIGHNTVKTQARALVTTVSALPNDYVVDEMAWEQNMELGELRWWLSLDVREKCPDNEPKSEAELCQEFSRLRDSGRPFQWRVPQGLNTMLRNPLKTASDIRADHVDPETGEVISFATLNELTYTAEWHGLRPGGVPFEKPCSRCEARGLACHYKNTPYCTNCFYARAACGGGVLDTDCQRNQDAKISNGHRSDYNPYALQPVRRFLLLKGLEDVLGGWDQRLAPTGEFRVLH
ncbi:hypothetical protein PENSPDRAFT_690747 [Peniophora sp. CONT]|nr:hypothetical protein PENSPDRAFT_690747 [Peniophora sp. CONT]